MCRPPQPSQVIWIVSFVQQAVAATFPWYWSDQQHISPECSNAILCVSYERRGWGKLIFSPNTDVWTKASYTQSENKQTCMQQMHVLSSLLWCFIKTTTSVEVYRGHAKIHRAPEKNLANYPKFPIPNPGIGMSSVSTACYTWQTWAQSPHCTTKEHQLLLSTSQNTDMTVHLHTHIPITQALCRNTQCLQHSAHHPTWHH